MAKKTKPRTKGPTGEPMDELEARVTKIVRALAKAYPDSEIPLRYSTPLELLIATILSAQCTDNKLNEVTRPLFKKYRTAADWAATPTETLEDEIHATGFFRSKARSIKESAADLVERCGGRVPDTIEELTSLRGIGRKTANVVLAHVYGKQAIIVDTHFTRLARRMGLTPELDPVKIEFEMMELIPEKHWSGFSLAMTLHGRAVCDARKPVCEKCVARRHCPAADSNGEITWKVKLPPARKKTVGAKPRVTSRTTGKKVAQVKTASRAARKKTAKKKGRALT